MIAVLPSTLDFSSTCASLALVVFDQCIIAGQYYVLLFMSLGKHAMRVVKKLNQKCSKCAGVP